ncbi:MAG: hypothetical protein Kow0031_07530 [Anaerolineae bacterium]
MALTYPDVIGDYLTTTERLAFGGLHLAGYYEPATIAPGEVTNLYLFMQNNLSVPLIVKFQFDVPKTGGFLRAKHPMLELMKPVIDVEMTPAEAGLLTVPVATTHHVKTGEHPLTVTVKASPTSRGQRVRPQKANCALDTVLIDSPVGLDLVSSLGATYTEKSVKKAVFPLKVEGNPKVLARAPKLNHSYETIWVEENYQGFNNAVQELNTRQVKLKNELTVEKLYVNFYGESVARFADCGMPMRIGEAITMAKILTYSAQYFLASPKRANGLLVPIWERAYLQEADTTDALTVLRTVGFHHVIRLATAVSFGLIAKTVGQQYWSLNERQAVANHIADSLDEGTGIDLEFMYLPLLIAGTGIGTKVKMQGEDTHHSVALMKAAADARKMLFVDDDMDRAEKIFNQVLKKALA